MEISQRTQESFQERRVQVTEPEAESLPECLLSPISISFSGLTYTPIMCFAQ